MDRVRFTIAALMLAVFGAGAVWLAADHHHESAANHQHCVACKWQNADTASISAAPILTVPVGFERGAAKFDAPALISDVLACTSARAPPLAS